MIRSAAGCIVLALALTGCGASAGSDARPPTTTTTDTTATTTSSKRETNLADLDAIRRYVEVMNRRDVDAAMELRCTKGRIAADDEEFFVKTLDLLLDESGAIGTATVVPASDRPITPTEPGDDERTYEVQFQTAAGEVGSPLYIAVIGQDGDRRLCGASPLLVDEDDLDVGDAGRTDAPPKDLMPTVDAPDYQVLLDEDVPPIEEYDEDEVWFRSWQYPTFGGASAFASEHPTDDAASAAATRQLGKYAPDAVATFDVPGLPDAAGMTVMTSAWLMIQPPGTGSTFDLIAQRFGDRVSVVRVTNNPGHRDLVVDMAQQVHDLAVG